MNATTVKHATGRIYDFAQVLEIFIPAFELDADGSALVPIFFNDRSRGIQGEVSVLTWEGLDNTRDLAEAVTYAYDRGAYKSVWRPEHA